MSTVGFGTIGELSEGGKLFSVFLIIFSVGTFLYAISTFTTFIVEGEMSQVFTQYQINKKVAKLQDHIIICGLGRNGREAAIELERQQQPFVVIELKEEVIEQFLSSHKDTLIIQGDATLEEVLKKANIERSKGLISSLSTDAENVYITLTAREIKQDLKIVARASNEGTISKLRRAGANKVILPNMIGGRKMANLITRPSLIEFIEIVTGEGDPDLNLEEVNCANNPGLCGKTLAELAIRSHTGILVIGFKAGEEKIELNPPPNRPLSPEDRLFVLGTEAQFNRFRSKYLS